MLDHVAVIGAIKALAAIQHDSLAKHRALESCPRFNAFMREVAPFSLIMLAVDTFGWMSGLSSTTDLLDPTRDSLFSRRCVMPPYKDVDGLLDKISSTFADGPDLVQMLRSIRDGIAAHPAMSNLRKTVRQKRLNISLERELRQARTSISRTLKSLDLPPITVGQRYDLEVSVVRKVYEESSPALTNYWHCYHASAELMDQAKCIVAHGIEFKDPVYLEYGRNVFEWTESTVAGASKISVIMKANFGLKVQALLRVDSPGVSNPYFLAGGMTMVVEPSTRLALQRVELHSLDSLAP